MLVTHMRLWTLHPKYLDPSGLTAAWREGLLARKVLQGGTKGYQHHPQLIRFRAHADALACIERYLTGVLEESVSRGYRFDATKVDSTFQGHPSIVETSGQLLYEWAHLKRKLEARAPETYRRVKDIAQPERHPLFRIVSGAVRDWERVRLDDGA